MINQIPKTTLACNGDKQRRTKIKFKNLRILYNRKAVLLNSRSPQCVHMNTLNQAIDSIVLWVPGAIENKNNMLGGKKTSEQILLKVSIALCVNMCVYTKEINKKNVIYSFGRYHWIPCSKCQITNVIIEKTYFLGETSLELQESRVSDRFPFTFFYF